MSWDALTVVAVPWHQPGPAGEGCGDLCCCFPLPPVTPNHARRMSLEWGPHRARGGHSPPIPISNGKGDVNWKPAPEEAAPAAGCPSELAPAASLSLLLLCCPLCPPSWAAVSLFFFTEHLARAAGAGSPLSRVRARAGGDGRTGRDGAAVAVPAPRRGWPRVTGCSGRMEKLKRGGCLTPRGSWRGWAHPCWCWGCSY